MTVSLPRCPSCGICNFPGMFSSVYISSLNDVGAGAVANLSVCGSTAAGIFNNAIQCFESYPWCKTKHHGHSVEVHFQDGAGSVFLFLSFAYKGGQYIKQRQWHTKVNILQLTVGYLNATMNRETRNPEPEIGTDRWSQTRRNPRVDEARAGFGLPRSCGTGFWTGLEPNQPIFPVQTRTTGRLPGPVANTRN